MDPIASLSAALTTIQKLWDLRKKVTDAEFRGVIAELSNNVADARMQMAKLKEQIVALEQENSLLKAQATSFDNGPVGSKWGCYQFEGFSGLYCTACWDTKRHRSMTTRVDSTRRQCPVCSAVLYSG